MTTEKTPSNNLEEKTNRWIDQNRERIGRKILCSGIGTGILQHLGHLFPDAAIVSLTNNAEQEAAVSSSSGNPDAGLRAPLCLKASLEDYDGGLFDTVIFLQDAPLAPADAPWDRGTLYLRRASLLMEHYEKEAHALCRHLRPGGTLLALVRGEHDEYLLGYCFALAAEQMQIDPSGLRQILCREDGQRRTLQGITATAGGRTEIGLLVAENLNFSLDRMNTAADELQGREAEILLQADTAGLIRGYHFYKVGKYMGKLAIYSSAQRPDVIYYFTDVSGDVPYLRRFHTQDQQKVLRHMVGELHRQKASDKTAEWHEIELRDNWEEVEI